MSSLHPETLITLVDNTSNDIRKEEKFDYKRQVLRFLKDPIKAMMTSYRFEDQEDNQLLRHPDKE